MNCLSLNVNGLRDYNKCSKLLSKYLYPLCDRDRLKPDVVCFQETHVTSDLEICLLVESNYNLEFAHNTSHNGGLITGFNRNLDYRILSKTSQLFRQSQILIIHCIIQELELVIANCYLHPSDNVGAVTSFFAGELIPFNDKHVMLCGDFNATLDPDPNPSQQHKRCVAFANFIEQIVAVDAWRLMNPEKSQYTHFSPVHRLKRRLDNIFVNEGLVNSLEDSSIGIAFKTDHSPVYLSLNLGRNPPGPGYWKFLNFLTKDKDYKQFLTERINDIAELNSGTDLALLWDTIKCEIRLATMSFLKIKKNQKKKLLRS